MYYARKSILKNKVLFELMLLSILVLQNYPSIDDFKKMISKYFRTKGLVLT